MNQFGLYFVTCTVANWVDLFTRPEYRNIILDSWRYGKKYKGLELHAWSVMSNYFQIIYKSKEGKPKELIQDIKAWAAPRLHQALLSSPHETRRGWILQELELSRKYYEDTQSIQLWKNPTFHFELQNAKMVQQKLDFIHQGPVKARIVQQAELYRYSSARDYITGMPGLIEIDKIDPSKLVFPKITPQD